MSLQDQLRRAAENDLITFIKLVAPHRVLALFHEDLIAWWTRSTSKTHQLVLVPRDHAKSALVAYRAAWRITKDPSVKILYISSTANLAEKQLKMIKDILTSRIYRRYWPDMVNEEEGKREKWTNSEISVDHPKRKDEGIRDPTVFTGGLTTSLTGLHCDVAILDDVVVQENAYTEEGREKVRSQYSLLSSIESADSEEWVVGTRYHPLDLYNDLMDMEMETTDEEGNSTGGVEVYEVFHRQVEDRGDGTGEFLWPRQQRADGKWFGFSKEILAKKKAQYLDKTQFWAQYYNDPNKYENSLIDAAKFQYFDKAHITNSQGQWMVRGQPIYVSAALDLAFSEKKKADFTVIFVAGMDRDGMIYVLDIDRFKTERISEIFAHLKDLYMRWGFRKIRMETSAAQISTVRELRDQYIRTHQLPISVDEYRPMGGDGTKEERILAALQPRYDNMSIWHYRGGNCQALEEELKQRHPAHDDIKDAFASVVGILHGPTRSGNRVRTNAIQPQSRFGGLGAVA